MQQPNLTLCLAAALWYLAGLINHWQPNLGQSVHYTNPGVVEKELKLINNKLSKIEITRLCSKDKIEMSKSKSWNLAVEIPRLKWNCKFEISKLKCWSWNRNCEVKSEILQSKAGFRYSVLHVRLESKSHEKLFVLVVHDWCQAAGFRSGNCSPTYLRNNGSNA